MGERKSAANPAISFLASGAPEAEMARAKLIALYGDVDPQNADVIVALGGDGMMLQTLHQTMSAPKPIYGMNRGSVGFLMNEYAENDLPSRLAAALPSVIHPLLMRALDVRGRETFARAFNEVSLYRQGHQACKLGVAVDGAVRLKELVADGVLVSTPAGSTAYNNSAGGPIVPIGVRVMALTPISAFRPRRWRGALLSDRAKVTIEVREADKRPVAAVSDHFEIRDVIRVDVETEHATALTLLHDPGQPLDERILREQFDA